MNEFQTIPPPLGHSGWVTSIVTSPSEPNILLSASRDKSIIVWEITRDEINFGVPRKSLVGHNHIVQDVALSSDAQFALSASWDHTIRLWDLNTGRTTRRFVGHEKDVLSVAFSPDNRQIVSGSRDKTIKLWNTLGSCKFTLTEDDGGHSDWVSSVCFSQDPVKPFMASCSWDKTVKIWDLTKVKLRAEFNGHNGYVNTVVISPDGARCVSGGKDGLVNLWDMNETKPFHSFKTGKEVHSLVFSPTRFWVCAAIGDVIKIWDIEDEQKKLIDTLTPQSYDLNNQGGELNCLCLAWSDDGTTLYAGYSDYLIRVWQVCL
ncbi:MAG: guanine nucleotide-binding protein [Benjaminiella poitrasii]|nr:MAG: guanine nucleotide-binding protein [Benjaminiella poitrasii]